MKKSTLLLVFGMILILGVPFFTEAAFYEYNDKHSLIYQDFAPSLTVDSKKNIITVWQDFRPERESLILMAKTDKHGTPLWQANKAVARPSGIAKFISADTDKEGNMYVSWMNENRGGGSEYIFLQKLTREGKPLWHEPFTIAKAQDTREDFDTPSFAPVRVDNNGNVYFAWLRRNTKTDETSLFYQVMNSEKYLLWEDGKKLRARPGMYILPQFGVDLEINKRDSLAYVSWVDASAYDASKTLNVQKINYNGLFQWYAPYPLNIAQDLNLVDFPGIELDDRENIFLTYLTTGERHEHETTLRFKRINRFGQDLWEDQDTVKVDSRRLVSRVGFAVDNDSKIYFLINTKDEIILYAYKPGLNSSISSDFLQMHTIISEKVLPQPGDITQAHSFWQGIHRLDDNHIVVGWNTYGITFGKTSNNELAQLGTSNEHVFARVFQSLLNETISPKLQVDTETYTGGERLVKITPPLAQERDVPKKPKREKKRLLKRYKLL